MFRHPAYPSRSDLGRERAAIAHDAADLATLGRLREALTTALAAIRTLNELAHQDRRMDVCEIAETLDMAPLDISGERGRMRNSPLVVEFDEAA